MKTMFFHVSRAHFYQSLSKDKSEFALASQESFLVTNSPSIA